METLIQKIKILADVIPDKSAVVFKNEGLTYGELYGRVADVASRLKELGIEKGDRVLFSALSKPETAVLYLAIQYGGAVAVFVDKNASAASAAAIYKDAAAKMFFTDKPFKGYEEECKVYSLRKVYAEKGSGRLGYVMPDEEDLAELIYTTGTTGVPKGCMHTYRSLYSIWTNTIDGTGMKSEDIVLLPLPLNHSFALRVFRACLYLGATAILQNGFTFAKEIEKNLDRFECTSLAVVPASMEMIARQMQDRFSDTMGRFRHIEVSAGSLTVEQRKRLVKQLPDTIIHNTWGSSESGGVLFLNVSDTVRNHMDKVAALGRPVNGIEIITLDEEGNAFSSDSAHPGRMAIRGDMQMIGYWNKSGLTAQTLKDGWLVTGDMVYQDEDGFLFMIGRADDIINIGGEKVSPIEVENAACEYEGVSECACVGVPDPDGMLGDIPVLFFAAKSKCSEDGLHCFLAERLEKHKIPTHYIEMTELPRNAMQKVDRKALRLRWEEQGSMTLLNETMHTIMTRRSIRRFSTQGIERNLIEMILKAGYHAPSGHNMQTWKFTVVTSSIELRRLKEAAGEAAKTAGVYFYGWDDPAIVILVSNDSRNPDGCQDASCASQNMMLAAWSYGIGSVWLNPLMTLRDKSPVKEILDGYGIPKNHIVWSTLAMGYPMAEGVKLKKNPDVVNWIE